MKVKGIYLLISLVTAALLVGIIGCQTPAAAPTTSTTPTTPAAEVKTIKIGTSCPLTGATASWGQEFVRAHELVFAKLKADGGVKVGDVTYNLELIAYDHKGQATEGVANVNKLIFQDGVKHISLHSSSPTLASLPITTQNKVISVASGYAKNIISPEFPYSFRGEYTGTEAGEGLYGYITANFKDIKTVAGIANDDDTGKSSLAGTLGNAEKFGLQVLIEEYVPRGTTDFYPTLTKMLPTNPDLVDLDSLAPADTALFIKQAREKGYKGYFVAPSQNDIKRIIDVAGEKFAEGYMQEGLDFGGSQATPQQREFYEAYLQKYGPPFEPNCGKYANFPVFWRDGFKLAQTIDPVELTNKMPDITINVLGVPMSLGGTQRYGLKHQVQCPVYVSQIQGGNFVTLGKYVPQVP